ncbi:hypothetical protein G5V59_13525 [Nocardioides sp. W3-2-3]|uniref:hypothetical protein n=1 Tax=Nocardioides convexus TaxID=2712224 RepID=UPI0024189306|nr:hypothetical protein [Nocardioides convexus]NHA00686.1 hypothetical protein [Nocardioides convexus]
MYQRIIALVAGSLFALIAVLGAVMTDLNDRKLSRADSARPAPSTSTSAANSTPDDRALAELARLSDEHDLGLVRILPDLAGDNDGRVFVPVGDRAHDLPTKVHWYGDQPTGVVRGPGALDHSFATGQYLATGPREGLDAFESTLTGEGVRVNRVDNTFAQSLSFLVRQESLPGHPDRRRGPAGQHGPVLAVGPLARTGPARPRRGERRAHPGRGPRPARADRRPAGDPGHRGGRGGRGRHPRHTLAGLLRDDAGRAGGRCRPGDPGERVGHVAGVLAGRHDAGHPPARGQQPAPCLGAAQGRHLRPGAPHRRPGLVGLRRRTGRGRPAGALAQPVRPGRAALPRGPGGEGLRRGQRPGRPGGRGGRRRRLGGAEPTPWTPASSVSRAGRTTPWCSSTRHGCG